MNNETPTSRPKLFFHNLAERLRKLIRSKHSTFEDSVTELIKEHHDSEPMHMEEKNILENILIFGDLDASDVMIPRSNITAVPSDIKFTDLNILFSKIGHTRIPVYKGSIDEIIGFIHVKDLFKSLVNKKKATVKSLIRELIFVPRTIKLTDLLAKMKQSTVHVAIVLDEHGGTDGLVTIEDIIEEVVGEITDEHDVNESKLIVFDDEIFYINAKAEVEDVEKELGIELSDANSEYDTFGGMIISYLGHIPKKGDIIQHPAGLEIEISDADHRRIKSTKVKFSDNINI